MNTLNQWVKEEIIKEMRKYLEANQGANTQTYAAAKAMLRVRSTAVNTDIKHRHQEVN